MKAKLIVMDGATRLIEGCILGVCDVVAYILKQGVDINELDVQGKSALYYTVKKKNVDMLEKLLYHNPDFTMLYGKSRANIFIIAVKMAHPPIINRLLRYCQDKKILKQKNNINDMDYHGRTALWYAIQV